MYDGIQDRLLSCGKSGCLFLDYLHAAELKGYSFSLHEVIYKAIFYKYIEEDFTVNDAEKLLNMVTGTKWSIDKITDPSLYIEEGDIVIKGYGVTKKVGHWEMDDFHPVQNSYNVRMGKVRELRICREIKY